MPNQKNE